MCAAPSYVMGPTIRAGVSHVAEHHPEHEVVASNPLLRALSHWGHGPGPQHRWTGCSELSARDETTPTASHPPYRRTYFDGSLSILGAPHRTHAPAPRAQPRPRPSGYFIVVFVIIPFCVILISGFFALILLTVECDVANAHGDEACQDVVSPASLQPAPAHTHTLCARPRPPVPDLRPLRSSCVEHASEANRPRVPQLLILGLVQIRRWQLAWAGRTDHQRQAGQQEFLITVVRPPRRHGETRRTSVLNPPTVFSWPCAQ